MTPPRGMYTPSNFRRTNSINRKALSPQTSSNTTPSKEGQTKASPVSLKADSITNPDELTTFIETLLEDLETKFDDMSTQVLDKMNHMSSRIDILDLSLKDLLNNDFGSSRPETPSSGSLNLRQ